MSVSRSSALFAIFLSLVFLSPRISQKKSVALAEIRVPASQFYQDHFNEVILEWESDNSEFYLKHLFGERQVYQLTQEYQERIRQAHKLFRSQELISEPRYMYFESDIAM